MISIDQLKIFVSIQGVILSLILFVNKKNRSNLYLGLLISFLSLHSVILAFYSYSFLIENPWVLITFDFLPYTYGPLIFFYITLWFNKSYVLTTRSYLHFIPALLDILFYFMFYILFGSDYMKQSIFNYFNVAPPIYVVLIELGKYLSGIIYIIIISKIIYNKRALILKRFMSEENKRWLIVLTLSFALCWINTIVLYIIQNLSNNELPLLHNIQVIGFLIFFYIITFFSLKYPVILNPKEQREQIKKKLNLSENNILELKGALDSLVAEDFYLDDEISLKKLALKMNTQNNILSFLLNEEYGQSFSEFTNGLRLNYFLSRLDLMDSKVDTILSLAFESGFSSKSTFNRVFKNKLGISPSEYKKISPISHTEAI